ncbi:MAG: winged helix-turn-helix transcriptional regulator [Nitrospirales bacterium]
MPGISSKVLTVRLRSLEMAEIINRDQKPTIPPQVFYGLTKEERRLSTIPDQINTLAYCCQDQETKKRNMEKKAKARAS